MENLPNWITAIAAIWAAFIACRGLATWKKELKGESEYEIAKQLLKSVHRIQEAFKFVRDPSFRSFEYPEKLRDSIQEWSDIDHYEAYSHLYNERLKVIQKEFLVLEDRSSYCRI